MDALRDDMNPALWISDYSVVVGNLNIIKKNGMGEPCLDQLKVLLYNNVPGCVMVFNKRLLDEMRRISIDQVRMHDVIALSTALITGKVIHNNQSFTRYRQHDSNVLGYNHKKINPIKWIKDKASLIVRKEPYDTSEYAREVLRIWGNTMDDTAKEVYHYKPI